MYLNKATVIGNLTRDVELRQLPEGTHVASFGIATNENYKNKAGVKVESVEFHNCVAWGKPAELIAQYMRKGSHILVIGKLRTSSWDDKETGKKMYKTEIVVSNFQFGRKNATATATPPASAPAPTASAPATAPVSTTAPATPEAIPTINVDEDVNPEEIPF